MSRDLPRYAISKLPETIRQLAYTDTGLCTRLGIETITRIVVGSDGFERRGFFDAVRRAVDSGRPQVVETLQREEAVVRAFGGPRAHVVVKSGRKLEVMRRLELLSADRGKRRRRMERLLEAHDLPEAVAIDWWDRCNRAGLTPDQLDAFNRDLLDTPRAVAGALRRQRVCGEISLDQLVPGGRRYYERLVCISSERCAASDCAKHTIAPVRDASDAVVVRLLPLVLSVPEGERAFQAWSTQAVSEKRLRRWMRSAGLRSDPYTCAAALEIACSRPTVEILAEALPIAERLLGDFDRFMERCSLFSSIVVATSALIGRDVELRAASATWRRRAAFAHAVLAHQSLFHPSVEVERLSEFALETLGWTFYVGAMLDAVELPLWRPQWVMPEYIAADVAGRLTNALTRLPPSSAKERIDLLVGAIRKKLAERTHPLAGMFPGLLQGPAVEGARPIPRELAAHLRLTWSSSSPVEACALAANIAMTAELPKEALAPYATALSLLPTPVTSEEWRLFAGRLSSAAYGAAAARAPELADAVAETLFRALGQSLIEPEDDVTTILLEASACRPDRGSAMNWLAERLSVLADITDSRIVLRSVVLLADEIARHDPASLRLLGRARAIAKLGL